MSSTSHSENKNGDKEQPLLIAEDFLVGKKVYLPEQYHGPKGTTKNPILEVKKIKYAMSDGTKLVSLEDGTSWGYSYIQIYEEKK